MALTDVSLHYTYVTLCMITGAYFGVHSGTPDDGYIGSGKRLWNSIQKHGKDAHQFDLIRTDPACMNMVPGALKPKTAARLEKLQARQREMVENKIASGYTHSSETRAKIGTNSGSRRPEVRAKISATLAGRKNADHSVRMTKRFSDLSLHPRTLKFTITDPSGDKTIVLGFDAVHAFCKDRNISSQRLIKYRGQIVPSGKIQGGRPTSYNTSDWSLS